MDNMQNSSSENGTTESNSVQLPVPVHVDFPETNHIWDNVYRLMIEDRKYRNLDAVRPLYTLAQVKDGSPDCNFDSYPIIKYDKIDPVIDTTEHFKQTLNEKFPFLYELDFNNILLAGGSIYSILYGLPVADLDLFIYGLDLESAKKRVTETVQYLCDWANDKDYPYYVVKTSGLVRVIAHPSNPFGAGEGECIEVQLIPRLYGNIGEILYGFDLGSSAVGYDGKQLYFSLLGRYAFINSANIIDVQRCSRTYATRLLKYGKRGFSVIAPLAVNDTYALRYLLHDSGFMGKSDYDTLLHSQGLDKILYCITKIKNEDIAFHCNCKFSEQLEKVLNDALTRSISYQHFDYVTNSLKYILSPFKFRLSKIIENFGHNNTMELLKLHGSEESVLDEKCMEIIKQRSKELLNLAQGENVETCDFQTFGKLDWIVENPGTQLTSSIEGVSIDHKEFYHDFYDKKKAQVFCLMNLKRPDNSAECMICTDECRLLELTLFSHSYYLSRLFLSSR